MKALKNISIMAFSAIFVCCANTTTKNTDGVEAKDTDTPTDVRSFGLLGNVKDVTVTIYDHSADAEITSWEDSTQYMKFDENGRILKDRMDNLYKYDDNGNFVYGVSEKTKMRRDEKGRIVFYENWMDDEDDAGFTINFEYDDYGRMTKESIGGWEATVDRVFTYTDDHIYPDRLNIESEDEGDHYSTVVTYTYKTFDDKGNWTERETHSVSKHTIEDEPEVETHEDNTTEKRVIQYYK